MISARPPGLEPQEGWGVLVTIANEGKRYEKLAALWRWSLDRMPNPIIYVELIRTLIDANKFDAAEAAFRELFEKFADERTARNLNELARVQARAEKFDAATATVREALKLEPNDADSTRMLAILLNQAGKPDEAIATLREALRLDVANPDLNSLLGGFLTQAGKNDEAIALFKGLIEKFPNNDEVVKAARQGLSTVYTNLGDFAKGEAELEILLAKDPADAGVNNDLGYLYADQGKNLEKRRDDDPQGRSARSPTTSAFLDSLGWVLFKRGKVEEARVAAGAGQSPMTKTEDDHGQRPPRRRLLPAPRGRQGPSRPGSAPSSSPRPNPSRRIKPPPRDPQEAGGAPASWS